MTKINKKHIMAATQEIREFNPRDETNPIAIAAQTESPTYYLHEIKNQIQLALNIGNTDEVFQRVIRLAVFGEAHRLKDLECSSKSRLSSKSVKSAKKE